MRICKKFERVPHKKFKSYSLKHTLCCSATVFLPYNNTLRRFWPYQWLFRKTLKTVKIFVNSWMILKEIHFREFKVNVFYDILSNLWETACNVLTCQLWNQNVKSTPKFYQIPTESNECNNLIPNPCINSSRLRTVILGRHDHHHPWQKNFPLFWKFKKTKKNKMVFNAILICVRFFTAQLIQFSFSQKYKLWL